MNRQKIIIANILKNIMTLIGIYLFYAPIKAFLMSLPYDAINYQTVIVCSSLLIMAFLFGAFGFTFKDSNLKHTFRLFLDQLQSALYLFGCGALLEVSYVAINLQLRVEFTLMGLLMAVFYTSLVLFDFYDLFRALDSKK